LQSKHDEPFSSFATNSNLRRYMKAAEVVGYESEEVMGRDLVEDFITPEDKVGRCRLNR